MKLPILTGAILLAGMTLARIAGASPIYQVTTLKNVNGFTDGIAMNDSAQATGVSVGADRAFITGANGANPLTLGNLGRGDSVGFAINNSGQVAGQAQTNASPFDHAFITDPGGANLRDLGHLGGNFSIAEGINAGGQVVGTSSIASGKSHAFITGANGNGMRDLGTLGGDVASAFAVNDKGQVTGTAADSGQKNHAFIASVDAGGVHMTDLGTLKGGNLSVGRDINASGRVAGTSDVGGGKQHAFLTGADGANMTDIGTLGGDSSEGLGVNDDGFVVGDAQTSGHEAHAFLFDGTTMLDLNDLIDPSDPLFQDLILEKAVDINDDGQILVTGSLRSDRTPLTFILTPEDVIAVPEPASLVLAFGGLVGLGWLHRRGRKRAGV